MPREPITASSAGAAVIRAQRRYFAVSVLYGVPGGFLAAVYPIFLSARGLNQFQINSVPAVFFIVLILTDVPTGALADALGRRRAFVAGAAIRACAFLAYYFSHRYVAFLLAECIDGVGASLCNGAIDAWGVDALDLAGFEGIKDRMFARLAQLVIALSTIAAIAGAYLADVSIALPWMFGAVGFAIAAFAGGTLMAGDAAARAQVTIRGTAREVRRRTSQGFRGGFSHPIVSLIAIAGAIEYAAFAPFFREWPILFNRAFGMGIWIVGWLECSLRLARIAGAELVARASLEPRARPVRLAWIDCILALTLGAAGTVAALPILSFSAILVMYVSIGAMLPIVQGWLNDEIPADQRATLLSFNSTVERLGATAGLLAGGGVADAVGIPGQWQSSALLILCAVPVYLMARARAARASAPAPAK